ncbi:hypothetical protein LTR04_004092 [Oleoguttula sp. CCFEE 6159]|nr:hypothetical protein LTR04_004092 [Oleoguttula sp. CCFEE 6159]
MAFRISTPRITSALYRLSSSSSTTTTVRASTPLLTSRFSPRPSITASYLSIMDKSQARGESTTGQSEWKTRPPYRIHESNDNFDAKYDASCHCGKVKYQLSREEPLDSKLCHCTTCQTQHAAPFQWAAIFHKEDINFSHGHHDLEWSIEHKLPCKVRCSFCHSPIMDEGRNMILLFPSLIKFKNREEVAKFKPRLHMFYGQRVMDIPDGLPKWTGLNDESDLIEDSPPEQVREMERKRRKEQNEKSEKAMEEEKKKEEE